MEISFIRHFATRGNKEKRYIGVTDEPLDAESIPADFRSYPEAEIVVVSPMKRCVETAGLLYPGIPQIVCKDFRECDFGEFEGKNYEELKDNPLYQKWLDSVGTIPFPGGESHEAFCERCVSGMEQIMERLIEEGYREAAVVVHGGTIMAVLAAFAEERQEFYHWQAANGKGYRVKADAAGWIQGRKYFTEIEEL